MYVKIIDKGECFSTTKEFIDGVYANREEWQKHNFYPQNGMVGEVVKRTPSAYIVKIKDGIYVPMTRNGIAEISYEEFITGRDNNLCSGMDERQKRINDDCDNILNLLGAKLYSIPDLRESFKIDIVQNMKKLTCDFKRNIFLPDLEESAIIYAADMCLEYQYKSGRELDPSTVRNIGEQVMDVYRELFSTNFRLPSKNKCIRELIELVKDSDIARKKIDKYYETVNYRYSWS